MTTATSPRITAIVSEQICIAAAVAAAKAGYQIAREDDVAAGVQPTDITWYRHEGRRAARATLKAYGFADEELQRVLTVVCAEVPESTRS